MHTSTIVGAVVGVAALILTALPASADPEVQPPCCGEVNVIVPVPAVSDWPIKFRVLEHEFATPGEAQCCPPIDKPIDP